MIKTTRRHTMSPILVCGLALGLFTLACEDEDPATAAVNPGGGPAATTPGADCAADDGLAEIATPQSCAPEPGDYRPRTEMSASDPWPACISDRGEYVPFSPNISSLARVAAWGEIGRLLGFGTDKAPTPAEFTEARVIYTQEQGIESRVSRREDEHHPPGSKACRDMTPEEQQALADRCAGPVKIRPILNEAFLQGMTGVDPARNAARIEGALVWHFYLSIFKEATSAMDVAVDTDSMWAKYTGGEPRSGGIGFARYVRPRSLQAHDRIWDGLLAVRCWRDLDNPTGKAMDVAARDRARAQLDRALLRGLALVVRQRASRLPCGTAWETVRIVGGALAREAGVRDPVKADILARELAKSDPGAVDKAALIDALDRLFPCP